MEKNIVKETDFKPTYISMGDIQKKKCMFANSNLSSAVVLVHSLWEELRPQNRVMSDRKCVFCLSHHSNN